MKQSHRANKRTKLQPGDILAISRRSDGYSFVVFITHHHFGEALGILGGHSQIASLPENWTPVCMKEPV
jgi:hypothetical protein